MPNFPAQASTGLLWDSRVASARRQGPGRNKSSSFVSTAFFTSNLLFAHSPNPLVFAAFTVFFTGGRCQPAQENFHRAVSLIPRLPFPVHSPHLVALNTPDSEAHTLVPCPGWVLERGLVGRNYKSDLTKNCLFPLLSHTLPEPFHFVWRLLLATPLFYDPQISISGPDFWTPCPSTAQTFYRHHTLNLSKPVIFLTSPLLGEKHSFCYLMSSVICALLIIHKNTSILAPERSYRITQQMLLTPF